MALKGALDLSALLQPFGGLCRFLTAPLPQCGEPSLFTCSVQLGNLRTNACYDRVHLVSASGLAGGGTELTEEKASILALAECLERYCASVCTSAQLIEATARDLGKEALDLDCIPSCSPTELSHPKCPLVRPNKTEVIRWVPSVELLSGRTIYVPAVMAYLGIGFTSHAERITLPITTGCAAHRSYEQAVVNGILEVIERDAIAITWLQRIPQPRIDIDDFPGGLADYWHRYETSALALEYHFFDATSDIGMPTVYGLQIAHDDPQVQTLVSCSTQIQPSQAVKKCIRDMAGIRSAFRVPLRSLPTNVQEFVGIFEGATYMAHPERRKEFAFLLRSTERRSLRLWELSRAGGSASQLRSVLECLRHNELAVYVVDLTTDEAIRVGMRVVKVIIPGLQPLSFNYRARFLGHPRLYEAPKRLGHRSYPEQQLNAAPQPFA